MFILIFRGRLYKWLLEYLFFMWDLFLFSGNSELIRVLEEGFCLVVVYEVCLVLYFIFISILLK